VVEGQSKFWRFSGKIAFTRKIFSFGEEDKMRLKGGKELRQLPVNPETLIGQPIYVREDAPFSEREVIAARLGIDPERVLSTAVVSDRLIGFSVKAESSGVRVGYGRLFNLSPAWRRRGESGR